MSYQTITAHQPNVFKYKNNAAVCAHVCCYYPNKVAMCWPWDALSLCCTVLHILAFCTLL